MWQVLRASDTVASRIAQDTHVEYGGEVDEGRKLAAAAAVNRQLLSWSDEQRCRLFREFIRA
jgi:hypothetical protein